VKKYETFRRVYDPFIVLLTPTDVIRDPDLPLPTYHISMTGVPFSTLKMEAARFNKNL
jgi:hypothetical protein